MRVSRSRWSVHCGCSARWRRAAGAARGDEDYLKDRAFPGWFHRWPEHEAHATTLRTFELVAVPGLLQTEDYAQVMLRTHVLATDDEVDEMVAARMDRQAILTRDKPPMLWVLLDEGVRRRPVGGSEVIADFADAPSVAYQDTAARGQILEDSDDLGAISVLWDPLHSEALARSASAGLMKEVLATWT